jgi:hypothetical protein
MPERLAHTVSIGLLAGLSCLLTGFVISVPIWVLFIAWASFFAAGGGLDGAARSLIMNAIGVVSATATMLAIAALGHSTWAVAGCVVIGAAILVLVTKEGLTSFTPAGFFGFASVVGTVEATGTAITAPVNLSHPVVLVLGAIVLGTAFGLASELLGGVLTKRTALAGADI